MSKKSWDRLSEADRKVIRASAKDAVDYQRQLAAEVDRKLLEDMPKQGVKIDKIDRAAFAKATQPVMDEALKSSIGEFVRTTAAEAQKIK